MPFTPAAQPGRLPGRLGPGHHLRRGPALGVQLAAAPGGEALLLSLARQLETLRPWPRHAPLEPVPASS